MAGEFLPIVDRAKKSYAVRSGLHTFLLKETVYELVDSHSCCTNCCFNNPIDGCTASFQCWLIAKSIREKE